MKCVLLDCLNHTNFLHLSLSSSNKIQNYIRERDRLALYFCSSVVF
uniref:Uncharacterized protein n=1 Tax=Meloidogyne enterolobii TaxID=390850 RepID=A0A6V7VPN9_MELEN|nr:unnamed protein product [Meloidogyne enterolobii]CAD2176886.1 unnamed protein product [Meloidogyne enterolobii]